MERFDVRYCVDGDRYTLGVWPPNAKIPRGTGKVGGEPSWLQKLITVGRIGGHYKDVSVQPPEAILWFCVDTDLNLIQFMEW